MHFTVIFESHESHDLSYGLVFTPCPIWKKGDTKIITLHPQIPHYQKGYLTPLLIKENIEKKLSTDSKKAIIIVHNNDHGTENYLACLQSDLIHEGFNVQQLIF